MLSLAAAANAQDWDEWYGERCEPLPPRVAEPSYAKPSVSVRGSIGITQDPETFLLGNVALRSGERIEWSGETMRIPNAPKAEKYLTREVRPGWEIGEI